MKYPKKYVNYLVHFHGDRDWFECHEILEEYWKENGMTDEVWVTLIQIAVGLYHQRRGNHGGALKMLGKAYRQLSDQQMKELGLDAGQLKDSLKKRLDDLSHGGSFEDFNLPIIDSTLLEQCIEECSRRHMVWQGPSNMVDEELIHRHTQRDRSEVVKEREASLKAKNEKKTGMNID